MTQLKDKLHHRRNRPQADWYLIARVQKAAGAHVHRINNMLCVYTNLIDPVRFEEFEMILRRFIRTGELPEYDENGFYQDTKNPDPFEGSGLPAKP